MLFFFFFRFFRALNRMIIPFPIILFFLFLTFFQLSTVSPSPYGSPAGGGFVYRCPITPISYMSPYGVNYCGTGSIFHYYVCCDYNPMECCLQLETWVIIGLVIVGLLTLFGCLGCCAVCLIMQKR